MTAPGLPTGTRHTRARPDHPCYDTSAQLDTVAMHTHYTHHCPGTRTWWRRRRRPCPSSCPARHLAHPSMCSTTSSRPARAAAVAAAHRCVRVTGSVRRAAQSSLLRRANATAAARPNPRMSAAEAAAEAAEAEAAAAAAAEAAVCASTSRKACARVARHAAFPMRLRARRHAPALAARRCRALR